MLVGAWIEAPDELSADFLRFFHIDDWTALPMRRAASLCVAMIRQPESWTFRKIVPEWQWAQGFAAIPEPLWWTFTTGYLGYTGARTYEKRIGVSK